MAKSKWVVLLVTELFSALSLVAIIVSFSTDHWVVSDMKYELNIDIGNSYMHYGLFDGKLTQSIYQTTKFIDLTIICRYDINKCFYSCQQTSDRRSNEFDQLLKGENLAICPASRTKQTARNFNEQVNMTAMTMKINYDEMSEAATFEDEFLSAGLWLTTVIFLALSSLFTLISAFFSMINILCNPISYLSSTHGLYVWNGIAALMCSITMIIYSSLFGIFISKNIAITDTLRTLSRFTSDGLAQFGFSFWILILSIFCHLINIGLVYYRNYLLQHQPKPPVITVHKNDSTILVY
ncbi:hypothetical protein ACKWTF_004905 [Chironomus riparius]